MGDSAKPLLVAVMILLLIPIPLKSTEENDKSVEYKALLYQVTDVKREKSGYAEDPYERGYIVKILGHEVYNNVK